MAALVRGLSHLGRHAGNSRKKVMKIHNHMMLFVLLGSFSWPIMAKDWDPQRAYLLSVAAKCAYSPNASEAIACLKAHPAFASLNETDIHLWHHPIRPDAYMLVSSPHELILAIRGTQPPVKVSWSVSFDWLNDIIIGAVENNGYHKGFHDSWDAIKTDLNDQVAKNMLAKLGSRPFLITGHSKGGSIATIATLDMTENLATFGLPSKPDETYEFEPSRSITTELAKAHAADFTNLWRFEYKNDLVPRLPTQEAPQTPNSFIDKIDFYINKIGFPAFASVGNLYYVNNKGEGKPINSIDEAKLFNERTTNLVTYLKQLKGRPKSLALSEIVKQGEERCRISLEFIDDHIVYWQWLAEAAKQKDIDVTIDDKQLHTLASMCSVMGKL